MQGENCYNSIFSDYYLYHIITFAKIISLGTTCFLC